MFTMPGSPITFAVGFLRPQETSNRKAAASDRAIAGTGGAQGVQGPCHPMAEGREAEAARLLLCARNCAGAWPEFWH